MLCSGTLFSLVNSLKWVGGHTVNIVCSRFKKERRGSVQFCTDFKAKPWLLCEERQGSHLSDDSELEFPSVGTLARDDTWTQELPCLWNCGGELSYCTESYRSEVPRGVPLIVNVSFSRSVRWNISALGSFYIKVWIEAIQGAEELERHE